MNQKVIDWFEVDENGYPTDDSIQRLEKQVFMPPYAGDFLINEFEIICDQIPCISLKYEETTNDFKEPVTRIYFSTGGWSGAEELIGTLLSHFWITHYHIQWNRGGHYIFEIPMGRGHRGKES